MTVVLVGPCALIAFMPRGIKGVAFRLAKDHTAICAFVKDC